MDTETSHRETVNGVDRMMSWPTKLYVEVEKKMKEERTLCFSRLTLNEFFNFFVNKNKNKNNVYKHKLEQSPKICY